MFLGMVEDVFGDAGFQKINFTVVTFESDHSSGDLGGIFFRADIGDFLGACEFMGKLGEESGFTNTRLTGDEVDATFGDAFTQDAIEFGDFGFGN